MFLPTVVLLAFAVQAELGDRDVLAQRSSSCDRTIVPPAECSEASITKSDDDKDGSDEDDNDEEDSKGGADIESKIPSVAGAGGVPFP